jgi:2-polyprenyl-6-hydroxyphenyl methylase/3-demethylubiquinone-9 3-methyltransferase
MRRVLPEDWWPDSWRNSYTYDLLEVYDDRTNAGYSFAYQNRMRQALELVQRAGPPGCRVLDAAAAQGNLSLRLAEIGYHVTWNDIREELSGYVAQKHECGTIEYLPGNVLELEQHGPWDVVVAAEVLEHAAHPDQVLAALARLLTPTGCLVVTTPNGEYFRNPLPRFGDCSDPSAYEGSQFQPDADGHIFLLTAEELRSLGLAAAMRVEELRFFTTPLTNGRLGSEPVLRRLPENLVWRLEALAGLIPQGLQRRLNTGMAALLRPS